MKHFFIFFLSTIIATTLSAQGFSKFRGFGDTSGRMIVANIDSVANPDIIYRSGDFFSGPGPLKIALNAGVNFASPRVVTLNTPTDIGSGLVAADMDGDGDNDLIASKNGEQALYLFTNDGNGTFTTSSLPINGVGQMLVADMNGDSLPDIIGTSFSSDELTVWTNDGAGSFTKTQVSTFDAFSFVAFTVGDIDADGDQDILLCFDGFANNNLVLYLNDGDLNFTAINPRPRSVRNILQVQMTDINNDGKLDILVADRSEIFAVPQTADGFGAEQRLYTSSRKVNSFAFGDFDENGLMDMVIGHNNDERDAIVLRANYGVDDTYAFDSIYVDDLSPTFNIIPADMDLDGDLDLVATNSSVNCYRNDLRKVPVSSPLVLRQASALEIHPNPASDQLNYKVPANFSGQVSIVAFDGRKVAQRENVRQDGAFSLAHLPAGSYLIIAQNERTGDVYRSICLKQ